METNRLRAFVLSGFIALGAGEASATVIVSHVGSNDPTSEGWTHGNPGSLGVVGGGSEVTASGLHDFWRVEDADTSVGGAHAYTFGLTPANRSNDWILEASVRVTSGPTVPGTTNVPPQAVFVADGLNYWSFYLGDSLVGPVSNASPLDLALSSIVDFSDYNTFRIEFSHNGAGTADDTADFFINGALVYDDIGRGGLFASSASQVYFGAVSSAGVGDANYEFVRFDDGVVAAAPEPGSMLLVASGALAVGLLRRRRK